MKTRSVFILLTAGSVLALFLSCGFSETDGERGKADEISGFLKELYERASEQLDLTVELFSDAVYSSLNLGVAAEKLGVAVETLTEALGTAADLETAAEKLKVPIDKLREALPSTD